MASTYEDRAPATGFTTVLRRRNDHRRTLEFSSIRDGNSSNILINRAVSGECQSFRIIRNIAECRVLCRKVLSKAEFKLIEITETGFIFEKETCGNSQAVRLEVEFEEIAGDLTQIRLMPLKSGRASLYSALVTKHFKRLQTLIEVYAA